MKKQVAWTALLLALLLGLSGCFNQASDSLYALPELSEAHSDLQAKISRIQSELAGTSGSMVEFAAPVTGENTQTIQLQDLDGDGEQESAVAFFRIPGAERPLRIYTFTKGADESYQVRSVIEGEGTAINSIYYADLDETPGKELVVSWQMSDNVYLLTAYSISGEEPIALMRSTYSSYEVMDIDRDGRSEILLVQIDPVNGDSRVELYDSRSDAMALVSAAPMSAGALSLYRMEANYLTDVIPALYVTSHYGEGQLVTDLFAVSDGTLRNLTLDEESGVSRETIRTQSEITGTDINNDYILELPRLTALPTTSAVEAFYAITWEQYALNGTTTTVGTTFHNVKDGWYLMLPESWEGCIAVQRSDTVTNNDSQRAITFSHWQEGANTSEPFLTIYRFGGNNRNIRANQRNRFVLYDGGDVIYAAEFYTSGWNCGLDRDDLTERFKLIISEW